MEIKLLLVSRSALGVYRITLVLTGILSPWAFGIGDHQKFHRIVALVAHLVRFTRCDLQPVSSIQRDGTVNKVHGGLSKENVEKLAGLLMVVHILSGAGRHFLRNNAQIIPLYQMPTFTDLLPEVV